MHEKEKLRKEEKKRIATAAAKLIEENDSIIIASGSTVHTFAEHITPINHLTVVTASLKTSLLLNTINNIEVIQLGGIVRKNSFSVIGDYTSLFFEQITCSKLFLGVDGIDLEYGITNSNIEEAVLKQENDRSVIAYHHPGRFFQIRTTWIRQNLQFGLHRCDNHRLRHFSINGASD